MIFSIFRFFCTLRFQIYKYCPIITNHTSMEILFIAFRCCINLNFEKLTLMTGFVLQGHICKKYYLYIYVCICIIYILYSFSILSVFFLFIIYNIYLLKKTFYMYYFRLISAYYCSFVGFDCFYIYIYMHI